MSSTHSVGNNFKFLLEKISPKLHKNNQDPFSWTKPKIHPFVLRPPDLQRREAALKKYNSI